ncbi:MAG: DEAD/DEAH box helicase [Acidobacteriota bacterium]|nr:DEAD/DEAH box helicase [Acidobacteriota bacterium]
MMSSSGFHRLHPGVQRWIGRERWTELRPIQEQAIDKVLAGEEDLLLSAPTAGGKTEAVFLPVVSRLAESPSKGLGCLCLSPLKALINDQFDRLELLARDAGVMVHRWHGDVPAKERRKVVEGSGGILLITPESLEAFFVLRGSRLPSLFRSLHYLVVDELHAFLGSARGKQLQSLLHRVEVLIGRRVPRIGLSATLGDLDVAAELLRPRGGAEVARIQDRSGGAEIRLQLRGYLAKDPRREASAESPTPPSADRIPAHLFRVLRGGNHLVFANSRQRVELLSDDLRELAESQRVPNEFLPHHGNLSRALRESTEARLKEAGRPTSVVCTSTLELGIDVGHVDSVVQVGRPQSVSALRQRLGRSGRRGEAAILRLYITESEVTARSSLQDMLRPSLVEALAVIDLLLENRLEPPPRGQLHFSTLIQQILSCIAHQGGIQARQLYRLLCRNGPFEGVDAETLAFLLRHLASRELITQTSDGDLVLGLQGERLVGHYSFYAAFSTPEEYTLRSGGKTLGSLPFIVPLREKQPLVFAGRRWKVAAIDLESKVADLIPAHGSNPPIFGGGPIGVADLVRRRMRRIYQSPEVPIYLDQGARKLLEEGRKTYAELDLRSQRLIELGDATLLFPWVGDGALSTLELWLAQDGLKVVNHGILVEVEKLRPRKLLRTIRRLVDQGPPDGVKLAHEVAQRGAEKYDEYLPPDLLAADYASRALDPLAAHRALNEVLEEHAGGGSGSMD